MMASSIGFRLVFVLAVAVCSLQVAEPALASTPEEYVILETASGRIRGITATTLFDNKPYVAFKGIPFAEPRIGKLRFKVCVFRDYINTISLQYNEGVPYRLQYRNQPGLTRWTLFSMVVHAYKVLSYLL